MTFSREIHIDPHLREGISPQGAASVLRRLKPYGRKLLGMPGLRALRPAARRVAAVAETPGKLAVRDLAVKQITLECKGITVLSANLWHDWPRQRWSEERLEGFARLVESHAADILLIQEVARTPHLRVDEWLSERLRMSYVYTRANGHENGIGFEEGLAVFSRYPLEQPRLRQLGSRANPFVRRMALGAQVETPCGKVMAFSVHLGLAPRQNALQLIDLQDWIARLSDGLPALIAGDFNAHEDSPQIRRAQSGWLDAYRQVKPHGEAATHELRWPWGSLLRRARLDYIFLNPGQKPWQVLDARHLQANERPHSDHHAVLARLAPVLQSV
ncbi:MAG TPA: endonuclease/exonuclease/phosphatase family protein [Anaerolineales bacterium]|nr:endonuclease/exonuclease/phosphatase family protein [Anaerolineales bacterium]